MTHKEAVYAHKSDECRGTCCTSHSDGSQARTQITSSPHSKIIFSLFWPVSINACLYSSMRLRGKRVNKYCCRPQMEKVFLHFPTACKEMLLFGLFWTEIRDFFPLVFSGRAPFFLANNGNSGAPRRCATVGDLPDCFGHLWFSSIKMTAVFHKNAEFGAGTERAR